MEHKNLALLFLLCFIVESSSLPITNEERNHQKVEDVSLISDTSNKECAGKYFRFFLDTIKTSNNNYGMFRLLILIYDQNMK